MGAPTTNVRFLQSPLYVEWQLEKLPVLCPYIVAHWCLLFAYKERWMLLFLRIPICLPLRSPCDCRCGCQLAVTADHWVCVPVHFCLCVYLSICCNADEWPVALVIAVHSICENGFGSGDAVQSRTPRPLAGREDIGEGRVVVRSEELKGRPMDERRSSGTRHWD